MSQTENAGTGPIEILLVEDNPRDAELTMRTVRTNRLAGRLVWVKDGVEAVDLIFKGIEGGLVQVPRLVLLDLKLPRMDGHEVLDRLKADERTRAIPVVILTSSQEEADLLRAYRAGANSFIVKPVAFDAFVEAVRQVGLYWLFLNQHVATPIGGRGHV